MKRAFSPILLAVLILPLTVAGQQFTVSNQFRYDGVVRTADLQPDSHTVHPAAARAIARGEKPGTFKNVRYQLASNVRMLTPAQKSSMKLQQDGILDIARGAFRPDPDSVYIDPSSNLVLQAAPVDDSRMLALRPPLAEVFDDIDIPEQEVPVTLANTISLAKGVVESALQVNNKYAVNLKFDSVSFLIDKEDNDSLVVTLVGQILLTNPRIEGKYTKNSGYRLLFLASEQVDMKIYTSMKLKEEVKTPLWGTEINISDLGKCEIGLFILTNVEGHVTLAVEIHQGIEMAMGASGGTFWYIPTSLNNISTIDSWCDVKYNITSEMKAFAGLHCTASLKIKGYTALDVFISGGMEGTVATDGMTLNADVGMRLKAGGKVISKKFTLLDNYYSLWKYQKPDYQGYSMVIHEACAWGDYVAGEIHRLVPGQTGATMDTVPYQGNLTVTVHRAGNIRENFSVTTGSDGLFIARNVPLKKGERVSVSLPGVSHASQAVDVTIPFREIKLYSADYYTGTAGGSVAGARSKWAKLAAAVPGSSQAAMQVAAQSARREALGNAFSYQETANMLNEFRNSLTVYRGPIEFITFSEPSSGGASDLQGNRDSRATTAQAAIARGTAAGKMAVQAPARPAAAMTAERIMPQKAEIGSPMGFFNVGGLTFEPGQKVKARIEVKGFVLESEWIETEGIIVSAIEHDGLRSSSRPGSETFSADNSLVVVSAIHSDTAPEGVVKMISGTDVPHSSLTAPQTLPEFPQAARAKVWFSQSVPLVPLEGHPGTAIASTGPWSVTYGYSSPGDALNPAKNGKHPFEMVTYIYKGKDLGYSDYAEQCISCTSPANIVEKMGRDIMPGSSDQHRRPSLQPDINVPKGVPQKQIRQPAVVR